MVAEDIDEELLQSILQSDLKCASTDRNEAVKIIFGHDDMWREMLLQSLVAGGVFDYVSNCYLIFRKIKEEYDYLF